MNDVLEVLKQHQLPSGQFPTYVSNEANMVCTPVHTIAPTYLISLILTEWRQRNAFSHPLADQVIEDGVKFLERMCYVDPVSGLKVWHFNAFYPPDWEETAWSSYLLYTLRLMSKKDLEPLQRLVYANETEEKGVGVWIKDPYSANNCQNNSFDPVVSVSVSQFMVRIFDESLSATEAFIERSVVNEMPSLYYDPDLQKFLLFLFGVTEKPPSFNSERSRLFHHGRRSDIWYESLAVWAATQLLM